MKTYIDKCFHLFRFLRILIFFIIIFNVDDITIMIILLHLLNTIYIIINNNIKLNNVINDRIEKYNDFCVSIYTIVIFLFTDYVINEDHKFLFGWYLMLFIFFNFLVGFFIPLIYENRKVVYSIQRKYKQYQNS